MKQYLFIFPGKLFSHKLLQQICLGASGYFKAQIILCWDLKVPEGYFDMYLFIGAQNLWR